MTPHPGPLFTATLAAPYLIFSIQQALPKRVWPAKKQSTELPRWPQWGGGCEPETGGCRAHSPSIAANPTLSISRWEPKRGGSFSPVLFPASVDCTCYPVTWDVLAAIPLCRKLPSPGLTSSPRVGCSLSPLCFCLVSSS